MTKKKILLIEPDYKNSFPPLGLMKIATAHRLQGDDVVFFKGNNPALRDKKWDAVYITTLFTFEWDKTINTINFYAKSQATILVGGILATLMPDKVEKTTGIKPIIGPYKGDVSAILKAISTHSILSPLYNSVKEYGIDALPPDYGIFENCNVPYKDMLDTCYIFRSTQGCNRRCDFCSVNIIHPKFIEKIALEPIVAYIDNNWGMKQNLVLLDDNILQSSSFDSIIDEISGLGFHRGARFNRCLRSVDFNQGIDLRLLTCERIQKLATIALKPLRLAFDSIDLAEEYEQKIDWAVTAGFKEISSYILFNYKDTPDDFYDRLHLVCKLNQKKGCRIYSFPMKYVPVSDIDRTFLGEHWSRRQIRGVQCILNGSHGIVPTKLDYFYKAFGNNAKEFEEIIQMPENYIIKRYGDQETRNEMRNWQTLYQQFSREEKLIVADCISGGKGHCSPLVKSSKISDFLGHYQNEKR